ncbi:MAG TPA: type II secretion system protein GspC [Steroidobacteraceae bacterium]|jgi:general secretion pathway protein C|nr:type II secretion system protein GspC [Steroidobacteraceae bacterium]
MNATTFLANLPPPDRWRALMLQHGPRIATWVLALALGVQAALIVTDLTGGKASGRSASSAPIPPPAPSTPRVNAAAIANAGLFGAPKPTVNSNAAEARPTNIPLVLTGVIAAADPRNGLAILGENAAAAKVYAVGDIVPGGVKLHSVFSDRVILDRDGTLESLALPRQSTGMAMAPPPQQNLPTENPIAERMRQLITSEPSVITDIMRPQPVFAQGKQRGYRVYPGRNRQAFTRLGLRPGDLVTAINGTPLDDPARGQEIFSTLGSSSEAHVTVMRNGKQQDLTLNMAQLGQEAEQLINGGDGAPPPGGEAASPQDLPGPNGRDD